MAQVYLNSKPESGDFAYAYVEDADGNVVRIPKATLNRLMMQRLEGYRNLLDNSYFINPVAQAGVGGRHGNQAYAVDRWILDSGRVSLEIGVGLTLNGTMRQKLEFPPAGPVSAFVGMASGEASITCADGEVTITSAGGVLQWAALFEGEYTADTRSPYIPKGYAAELAECQRYYRRSFDGNSPIVSAGYTSFIAGNSWGGPAAVYPFPMRETPTVTIYNPNNGTAMSLRGWNSQNYDNCSINYSNRYGFAIRKEDELTSGALYCFHYEAIADL